ncbi:MAG: hypothetical protein WCJ35_10725 [Planctomycetota bacterium]
MTMTDRKLFRAAVVIQEQSSRQRPVPESIYLPDYSWNHLQQLKRNITRARERGWHLAAQSLLGTLPDACRDLQRDLEASLQTLATHTRPRLPTNASAIYQDLRALQGEFDKVEIDLTAHELTVTTETIELEGVLLGEFQIKLYWTDIGQTSHPYRVVALDPNPAARREDVTHPHVQDEQLCEGDGRAAIAAALAESRFYDFFLLVNQVLHSYGEGSAYVELSDWDGTPCADCGTSVSDDDRYYCHRCDSTLCDSCSSNCQGCDNSHCTSCLQACADCGELYCSSCLKACPVCRKRFCPDCRQEGLCTTCYEILNPKTEEPNNDSSTESQCETACLVGQGS